MSAALDLHIVAGERFVALHPLQPLETKRSRDIAHPHIDHLLSRREDVRGGIELDAGAGSRYAEYQHWSRSSERLAIEVEGSLELYRAAIILGRHAGGQAEQVGVRRGQLLQTIL